MSQGRVALDGGGGRRLDSIQVMRGVAALLVVFAHAADVVRLSPPVGDSRIAGVGYLDNFGAIGVDLFFIISGFVMALSAGRLAGWREARNFLVLRWARVAPPYLLVTALLASWFLTVGDRTLVTARGLLNAVLFVPVADTQSYSTPPLPVGWTLSFEFTFYLMVAAMVVIGLARRLELLALALVLLGLIGAVTDPSPYLLSWATNPILIEFALGIAVHGAWKRGWLVRARPLQLMLGATGAIALVVQLAVGYGQVSESREVLTADGSLLRVAVWGVPCALLFVAFLPVAMTGKTRVGRAARSVGDASYSIYLVHLGVFLVAERILNRLPDLPIADVVLLVCIAVAVFVGLGYYRWVERPLTERARRVLAGALGTRPHLESATAQAGTSVRGEHLP